ncbi:MAG: phosphoribosyl-AMP cyclohydrolase [Lentisphaerae bacterium]|jgi:phosphoribosyl-AMP cyclohydrolase|nr:phosphoribosyl-AMP cyclohydrolase [Lentisphaerota bacterium]
MVKLDFSKSADGLIPAIAQDAKTGEILMQAYINEEAWNATLATGVATYWTRSRKKLWVKGETSGNVQKVKEILVDCDLDCVIFKIEQVGGAACHEGYRSCFFRRVEADGNLTVVGERVFDPSEVYKK